MLKIKLANNNEYEVLENTAIYLSYGAGRNRMEIHMDVDAMTVEEFEGLFTEANTAEIHLLNGESDMAYFDYSIIASIGKKRVSSASTSTGEVSSALELVVELEQLTYIEKQLKALGIQF